MGVSSLLDLFSEKYYTNLEGGILEAFGKLFTKDLRLYVYPLVDHTTGVLKTLQNIEIPDAQHNLFRHLVERSRINQIDNFDQTVLHIFSRDVLRRISENDASWENMVPLKVAEMVKRRKLFGYRAGDVSDESSFVSTAGGNMSRV
jgi:hypothetical protein